MGKVEIGMLDAHVSSVAHREPQPQAVPFRSMWRTFLTPKWLGFHTLVAVGVGVMTFLGFWQLNRLDDRRAFNDTVIARTEQSPRDVTAVLNRVADDADLEWTPVTLQGRWLAEHEVLVINRSQGGVAGRNVVTPVQLDDGTVMAVTRGFVSLTQLPPPVPGDGVRLRGLLRPSEERSFGGVRDPSTGRLAELQRLDLERLRAQLPADLASRLASWSVSLEGSDPPQPAPLLPVPRPTLSEGTHLSYAVQWFVFALCAVVGWVFAMRRSIMSRRGTRHAPTPSDAPASGSDVAATAGIGTPTSSPG